MNKKIIAFNFNRQLMSSDGVDRARHVQDNIPDQWGTLLLFSRYRNWNLGWRVVKAIRHYPFWQRIKALKERLNVAEVKVCEVGCGNEGGILAGAPKSFIRSLSYVGFNPELDRGKVEPFARAYPNVRFRKGYADQQTVPKGSQDVVVCSEILEHISQEERLSVIANMLQFIGPHGILIVSYPVKGTTGLNEKMVKRYIEARKDKFGKDDFTWDIQHFEDDDYTKTYRVPSNDFMREALRQLSEQTGDEYELEIIPNINIKWWYHLYCAQYGVYPILHNFSRIIFGLFFPLLRSSIHYGETFREIYVISKKQKSTNCDVQK